MFKSKLNCKLDLIRNKFGRTGAKATICQLNKINSWSNKPQKQITTERRHVVDSYRPNRYPISNTIEQQSCMVDERRVPRTYAAIIVCFTAEQQNSAQTKYWMYFRLNGKPCIQSRISWIELRLRHEHSTSQQYRPTTTTDKIIVVNKEKGCQVHWRRCLDLGSYWVRIVKYIKGYCYTSHLLVRCVCVCVFDGIRQQWNTLSNTLTTQWNTLSVSII